MHSGYGLIPRKRECQPWHARSSHLAATQSILFEAYTKFSAAFFCSKKWSKCDLCASVWQQYLSSFVVFLKDAQRFAQRHDILFMEVSAFTGMNVHNLFSKIGTFTLSVLMNMCYWPNVMSRWLDIGQVLFVSVNRNTQRKPTSSPGKVPWRRGWKSVWATFIHLDWKSLVNKGYIVWRKAGPSQSECRICFILLARVFKKYRQHFRSTCSVALLHCKLKSVVYCHLRSQLATQQISMLQVAQNMLRKVDPNSAFLANFQSVYNLRHNACDWSIFPTKSAGTWWVSPLSPRVSVSHAPFFPVPLLSSGVPPRDFAFSAKSLLGQLL